jgi:tRNA A-37 threonylcarbamoyl transferase component Bud32
VERSDEEGGAARAHADATTAAGKRPAADLLDTLPIDPATASAGAPPPRPTMIGRFEIKGTLGAGGMGTVLLAVDPVLGRRVAIKVLHRDGVDTDDARRRLLREAQGMAQLTHENIIVVHEVGTHAGEVYLAMEYVTGTTLARWQADRSWREIVDLYVRAGHGLIAAHEAGLVHRDFKPDNVLVGDDGRVRVTDFGLVASTGTSVPLSATEVALRRGSELAVSLTMTGAVMGTPRYMAPEQHLGQPVDARADQFAFCVALYEALYKQPPFPCASYAVLAAHVVAGEVLPVPADSDVPAALRELVLRGLRRAQDQRHPSMRALVEALVEVRAPVTAPHPRRWLAPVGIAIAVVAALAIGAVVMIGRGSTTAPAPSAAGVGDALAQAIAVLADPGASLDARRAAARSLGASQDARARRALWTDLMDERDDEIRRIALAAHAELVAALDQPAPRTGTAVADRPWATGVSAAEQRAALEVFTFANKALSGGFYREAAARYREALTHWHHPAISYNLALALLNLDDPVALDDALTDALKYGAAALEPDKFERAQGLVVLVRKQIAQVEIAVAQPGAVLVLDGQPVFKGPGTYTGRVRAGAHTVAVRSGDRTLATQTVTLAGGERWRDDTGP